VCGASGSRDRTIASHPLAKFVEDFAKIACSQGYEDIARLQLLSGSPRNGQRRMFVQYVNPAGPHRRCQVNRRCFAGPRRALASAKHFGDGQLVRILQTRGQFVQ